MQKMHGTPLNPQMLGAGVQKNMLHGSPELFQGRKKRAEREISLEATLSYRLFHHGREITAKTWHIIAQPQPPSGILW